MAEAIHKIYLKHDTLWGVFFLQVFCEECSLRHALVTIFKNTAGCDVFILVLISTVI
jgi:hypothetical protein